MNENYVLLPFNFKRMFDDEVLLINQAGDFIFVSNECFNDLLNGKLDIQSDKFLDLKSRHFATDTATDTPVNLLATKYRSKKGFLKDFSSLHMVVVTARCNCRCDYCHASSSDLSATSMDMTWDTAKRTVDMIFRSPSPHIKIEFQGGEPLLNWKTIVDIVKYAKVLNKIYKRNLSFVICTNLLLMNDKKMGFCKDNNILISTSLDGPEDIYDAHRHCRDGAKGYKLFTQQFELVRNALGKDACSPLATVSKTNLTRLRDVIDEYIRQDINGLFIRSLNPYGFAKTEWEKLSYSTDEFLDAYKDAFKYIIELNKRGVWFSELYASLIFRRIMTPFATGFVDLQSPSGAGISGVIYDYNGEVYPADEGRMLARTGDKRFLLGTVHDNSYEEIFGGKVLREIVANSCVETMPGCAFCAYQIYCGADPVRNYVESRDILGHRPTSEFCKKNMGIIDFLFEIIHQGDDEVLDILWSWVTKRGTEDCTDENC